MADQGNRAAGDSRRLEEELGLPFLAFILNASEEEVRARLRERQQLKPAQESVLAEVLSLPPRIFPEEPSVGYGALPSVLLERHADRGTSNANALRIAAGGAIPRAQTKEGTVDHALEQLAIDCYGAALLPPDPNFPRLPGRLEHLSGVMHRHPEKAAFEEQLMKDKELAVLFPNHTEQGGYAGSYYTNLGYGGGIQLWLLAEGLINAAYSALSLDGIATHESVVGRSVTNLAHLRALVGGNGVSSKARLGIAGIQLQDVDQFVSPWGVLRKATSEETSRIGSSPASPTETVLEVPIRLKLYLGSGVPPEGESGVGELGTVSAKLHADLKDRWTKLALSIFLGVDRQPAIAATHAWTIFDEVVTGTSGMAFSSLPWAGSWALTAEDLKSVGDWAQLVDEHYHRSIAVAADRIIKAVAHRPDPADSLIDTVIALENLFGTSSAQGELVFRISTGCAWLLEGTAEARRERRKEVRDIYDERSKIVHGNSPSQNAAQHRDRALVLVRRSIRTLLKDRPELIRNRDRSSELTLGA